MNDYDDEGAVIALLRRAADEVELDTSRIWNIVREEMRAHDDDLAVEVRRLSA